VTRTDGDEDDNTVSWTPKPTTVTEFNAIAEYSTSDSDSWVRWALLVGGAALLASVVATLLALIAHRRSLSADRAQATAG
jgi:hypothetical protein